jgi:hypothetical protein
MSLKCLFFLRHYEWKYLILVFVHKVLKKEYVKVRAFSFIRYICCKKQRNKERMLNKRRKSTKQQKSEVNYF